MLADNDVVIALSQMDVIEDALSAVQLRLSDVGSLAVMLRYMGKASEANRMRFMKSKAAADRFAAVLQKIVEIEPTLEERQHAASLMKAILLGGWDIDEGELVLIVVALHREPLEIATGDKRALRHLPLLHSVEPKLAQLRLRFWSLEHLLIATFKKYGFSRIQKAVTTDRASDGTITTAYDYCVANGEGKFSAVLALVLKDRVERFAPGWLKPIQ